MIVKNSHGRHWGEEGYARISLTKDYGLKGVCGVLRENYYGSFDELWYIWKYIYNIVLEWI